MTSNFLNHYSYSLSKKLKECFDPFYFVVKEKVPEDRLKLGFADLNEVDFVIREYEEPEKTARLFEDSDVVITDYTFNKYALKRLKQGKLTFVDSERLFKNDDPFGLLLRNIYYRYNYYFYKKAYLLCVSAFAAGDYNSLGLFIDRTYKWGYFSEAIKYDTAKLFENKMKNSILWVGRLIKWKHPEYMIDLSRYLKEKGYDFEISIIGIGPMQDELNKMIIDQHLDDNVHMLGSMSPEKVREYMERSEIYVFSSDRGEGWGVVLNEAMNSMCACVASYAAGSTPFLIKENANGMIYRNNAVEEMINKVERLLVDDTLRKNIAQNAYRSILEDWNPETAAKRFYEFASTVFANDTETVKYEDGILSKALPLE